MRRIRFIVPCAALLLAMACISSVASAQVLYGSLTGNVTDPSGAAVPSAKVDAVNNGTGVSRQTGTDERGAYLFNDVAAGIYKVTVTHSGFKTVLENAVLVNANEVRRIDVALQIAQATETVEVSASSVVLQTDKADVHAEVTAKEIEELPYNGGEGKNFQALLFMVPGAGIDRKSTRL